jgi:hypothetical protein
MMAISLSLGPNLNPISKAQADKRYLVGESW